MLIPIHIGPPLPGFGYIAGQPPADPMDPASPDGRTRVLGALKRVTVELYDRATRTRLRSSLSAENGTWHIGAIPTGVDYFVIFMNEQGYTVTVGAEDLPVNSFIQDFISPAPYED